MLITDSKEAGNRLYRFRRRTGMTQAEVAETAGLSNRTYADIERGSVNMRVETLLKICSALSVTPDDILTDNQTSLTAQKEDVLARLEHSSEKEKRIIWNLLAMYLDALKDDD